MKGSTSMIERIKALRKALNMSQAAFEKALNFKAVDYRRD